MGMNEIKTFLFDVFGTVVDWRSGIACEANLFLQRYGAERIDPLIFADAWRAEYQPAMEEVRTRRRPFVRLDVLHRENLELVLPKFGINPTKVSGSELEELNNA